MSSIRKLQDTFQHDVSDSSSSSCSLMEVQDLASSSSSLSLSEGDQEWPSTARPRARKAFLGEKSSGKTSARPLHGASRHSSKTSPRLHGKPLQATQNRKRIFPDESHLTLSQTKQFNDEPSSIRNHSAASRARGTDSHLSSELRRRRAGRPRRNFRRSILRSPRLHPQETEALAQLATSLPEQAATTVGGRSRLERKRKSETPGLSGAKRRKVSFLNASLLSCFPPQRGSRRLSSVRDLRVRNQKKRVALKSLLFNRERKRKLRSRSETSTLYSLTGDNESLHGEVHGQSNADLPLASDATGTPCAAFHETPLSPASSDRVTSQEAPFTPASHDCVASQETPMSAVKSDCVAFQDRSMSLASPDHVAVHETPMSAVESGSTPMHPASSSVRRLGRNVPRMGVGCILSLSQESITESSSQDEVSFQSCDAGIRDRHVSTVGYVGDSEMTLRTPRAIDSSYTLVPTKKSFALSGRTLEHSRPLEKRHKHSAERKMPDRMASPFKTSLMLSRPAILEGWPPMPSQVRTARDSGQAWMHENPMPKGVLHHGTPGGAQDESRPGQPGGSAQNRRLRHASGQRPRPGRLPRSHVPTLPEIPELLTKQPEQRIPKMAKIKQTDLPTERHLQDRMKAILGQCEGSAPRQSDSDDTGNQSPSQTRKKMTKKSFVWV